MALLSSASLRKRGETVPWKSDRRLYVDAGDRVVEADDPNRAKLLVNKGGHLPMEEARRYGLVQDASDAPPAQRAANTPPEAAAEAAARGKGGKKA